MFPENIQIETTTLCSNGCIMCPYKFVSRPKFMPMRLIDKIIDECSGKNVTIIPHQMGDPLSNDRIINILKKCKDKKLEILMSASGLLLEKEKASESVNIGVDIINISLDSLNKEIYEKIRNISFNKIMKNIRDLLSLKKHRLKYGFRLLIFSSIKLQEMNLLIIGNRGLIMYR